MSLPHFSVFNHIAIFGHSGEMFSQKEKKWKGMQVIMMPNVTVVHRVYFRREKTFYFYLYQHMVYIYSKTPWMLMNSCFLSTSQKEQIKQGVL